MQNQYGGKRRGAGLPPKADEIKMIEQMDAVAAPEMIWTLLFERCAKGDTQAMKTWLAYRYGQPRDKVELAAIAQQEEFKPPIIRVVLPKNAKSLLREKKLEN